ncbi:MAG: NAD(P)H-dependent glycerol-3-phosphate dehydrogenase [Succinivibrionaceae bacterium]
MEYSISVFGAGSYGTALAISLARNNNKVLLWGRDSKKIERFRIERCNNLFLPGVFFPDSVDLTSDIKYAVESTKTLLIVVPSASFKIVLESIAPYITSEHRVAWATKGLEPKTGRLLSDVAKQILGDNIPLAAISGPTFAKELAIGLPTAISVSGTDDVFTEEFSLLIHSTKNLRVYKNPDLIGMQIGGCVKNVIAIGTGLSDGLGYGANARTALITRGLVELQRLGVALGGMEKTFMGMAGLGDLVLTCTDNQSRNRRFGLALGKGASVEEAMKEIGQVVEGYSNTEEVHYLASKFNVEMPICEEIYQVLYNGKSVKSATASLLSRTKKCE